MDDPLGAGRSAALAAQTIEDLILMMSCLDMMVRSQSVLSPYYCQVFSISFSFHWFLLFPGHSAGERITGNFLLSYFLSRLISSFDSSLAIISLALVIEGKRVFSFPFTIDWIRASFGIKQLALLLPFGYAFPILVVDRKLSLR